MKTNSSSPRPEITLIEFLVVMAVPLCLLIGIATAPGVKEYMQKNNCAWQLQGMQEGKEFFYEENRGNTNACKMSDIAGNGKYFSKMPVCLSGGVYIIGEPDQEPTCSWHTTRAAPNRAAP